MMASSSAQGQDLAIKLRKERGLANSPISSLAQLEDLAACDVVVADMPDGVDGLTLRDPQTGNILIGVATSTSPFRQRFTLAHEIGHIVAGDVSTSTNIHECTPKSPEETRAHSFARNLLCPVDGVKAVSDRLLGNISKAEMLSRVVRMFQVSPEVAAYQLKAAKLVTAADVEELKKHTATALAARWGWINEYNGCVDLANTPHVSPRLIEDVTAAYLEGHVTIGSLAFVRGDTIEDTKADMDLVEKEALKTAEPNHISQDQDDCTEASRERFLADFFGS
ncbi:ImmA/IrrE family metallo-endopeptidase [Trueperella pyogenes]|uniref:ImmA/IrrE family metallo-endopeptidase n=1 Tax=Trueperella pyogenes TaxID=1661 RepID=UPI0024BF1439|nr:ImmA/IrrE family metallo-endopeptidase [Trueperella pyogenes]WHU60692.1 ImmA/IrrE family metallo-endopeptidase [Trueperella pyogenes]